MAKAARGRHKRIRRTARKQFGKTEVRRLRKHWTQVKRKAKNA